MTASPEPVTPEMSNIPVPVMFAHIVDDLHDISQRLARLEMLADEFAPAARRWQGKTLMRSLGHGRRNGM
jgi:hypothetical protein